MANDEGLVADLLRHNARRLEVLRERMHLVWVGDHEFVDIVQRLDGGAMTDRCAALHVLHLRAARFGQRGSAVFEQ